MYVCTHVDMIHMKLSISGGRKKVRVKYPKCQMQNSAPIFIETVILTRNTMKLTAKISVSCFCLVIAERYQRFGEALRVESSDHTCHHENLRTLDCLHRMTETVCLGLQEEL
jgi:hypothetical protein